MLFTGLMLTKGGGPESEGPASEGHGVGERQRQSTGAPEATTGARSEAPGESGPHTVDVGDTGTDGDVRFRVGSLSCGKKKIGTKPMSLTADGKFCVAEVRLTNVGGKPQRLSFDRQKLYDTKHKSYLSAQYAPDSFPGEFLFDQLKPNQTTSGPIVFDVPEPATVDYLVLHGGGKGKGLTVRP